MLFQGSPKNDIRIICIPVMDTMVQIASHFNLWNASNSFIFTDGLMVHFGPSIDLLLQQCSCLSIGTETSDLLYLSIGSSDYCCPAACLYKWLAPMAFLHSFPNLKSHSDDLGSLLHWLHYPHIQYDGIDILIRRSKFLGILV